MTSSAPGRPRRDERLHALETWLHRACGLARFTVAPASADASFRRYFRVTHPRGSHIAMDAPPERESVRPFVHVAGLLRAAGVHAPRVWACDAEAGFVLLDDLGSRLYLDALGGSTVERLYGDAMDALARMQAGIEPDGAGLPPYDRPRLMQEMALFRGWYLERHLDVALTPERRAALDAVFERLAAAALEQPRVFVHRDYHSRNLMVTEPHNPGVLDFQDAVIGPMTYDLVSLLRDCYIAWPRERVEGWALEFHARATHAGARAVEPARFLRWFDLMGVQRHLKAAGIFARLHHRDGKPGYLADIPRTLGYVLDIGGRYGELETLMRLLDELEIDARAPR